MGEVIGRVAACWLYPVKSFQGEPVSVLDVAVDGPDGDRAWAVVDTTTGTILGAKRRGELLHATASTDGDGGVWITLPDGRSGRAGSPVLNRAIAKWLDGPYELRSVVEHPSLPMEMASDNENERSPLIRWRTPRGRFVDLFALHLLTTTSLGADDVRRFRPNLVLDLDPPLDEDAILGGRLTLGGVELAVPDQLTERCVMITRAQPGVDQDRGLLRRLAHGRGATDADRLMVGAHPAALGCYGEVITPGAIRVGAAISLEPGSAVP